MAQHVAMLKEMTHQVGGHSAGKGGLKSANGKIFKPFQSSQRGEREHEFYEQIFITQTDNPIYRRLQPLVPKYHGVISCPRAARSDAGDVEDDKYLVLEDLTWERKWPCIMDVKVGTKSYESGATPEKIAYEKQKFPLQETVGLRIQGIKVFDAENQQYIEINKHFGRQIASTDALLDGFSRYFTLCDANKRVALLQTFLERLKAFKAWFDEQQELEFIASSLLFLYDGESSGLSSVEAHRADIRLIDFAHVTYSSPPKRDDGVCIGIQTIIQCFQTLLIQKQ